MTHAIYNREFFCFSQLDKKIKYELESMSKSTQQRYSDLPWSEIELSDLLNPNSAFGFLLRRIGVPVKANANAEQRKFVEGFVSMEMTPVLRSRPSERNTGS
jgi:hypothetical protein